jgi:large subunit ribosomal protein L4
MPRTKKTLTTETKKSIKVEKPIGEGVVHVNLLGELQREIVVPDVLSKTKINKKLIAQAVRVYRSNLRQGTQSTKTRGEVVGSTRKIYRQKGTGKARHGDIKAPIFVGGGIVFGPKPREFDLKLPKKMRHLVLNQILAEKAQNKQLIVITGLDKATGKTSEIFNLLKNLQLHQQKSLLILKPEMQKAVLGSRNIANITLKFINNVSSWEMIDCANVLFAKESWEDMVKLISKN